MTGEITGQGCQPWQTGAKLPPNVQYETQITTEECEQEELCARQDAFMLRMWLFKELGKDEREVCVRRDKVGMGWVG